jgi:hypothetical protein
MDRAAYHGRIYIRRISMQCSAVLCTDLYGPPPHYDKLLRSLHEEPV